MKRLFVAVLLSAIPAGADAATLKLHKTPTQTLITPININCGIPPIPPIGCRIGPCQCDASGRFCQWTFICG